MVLQKLAINILNSPRVRALWQSNTFGLIVRLSPRWFRQYMKNVYRRFLVEPIVLPSIEVTVNPWNHRIPILSVVIPCHNYGQYLREALWSLESQTFNDFEIIIVDDGSDDRLTLETLDDLRREGIRVLRQDKLNVAAALNNGISIARGRYICCFAADDKLEPTYFEKCTCLLESNLGVAFAYSLVRTFGDENRIWLTEPFDLRLLLEYNHICATAVFQKLVWEKVGGFDVAMDGYEDWDFWIKAGKTGFRGRLIPEVLFNYRRHGITLNLRADKKSQKLIDHIWSTHAELFAHPKQIKDIQKLYRDVRVTHPFLNVSSKNQYWMPNESHGILIASSEARVANLSLNGLRSETKLQNDFHPILVTTGNHSDKENTPVTIYALSRFLDSYCWLDFLLNLIETRSACFVAISDSEPAYEWTPIIRERTSVMILNIIQDHTADYSLSVRYDEFIDLHVVSSERIMQSLIREFGVSSKKIHLLSKMPLLDKGFINQLNTLAQKEGEVA